MRAALAEWGRSRWLRWLLVVAALLGIALVVWRGPISERLVPDPRLNQRLQLAEAALAAGRLSAADGSGARELFDSVLAADPDQMVARAGLDRVRDAAIERAQQALGQRRLAQARHYLALAESLRAPTVQLQALQSRLRDLEAASSDIAGLLARARAPGTSDEAALALYNRVLRLDAEQPQALEGRRALLAAWLVDAEAKLQAGELEPAQDLVAKVIDSDPAHLDLPPVRARLGEALAQRQREQARLLERAQADERAGRSERAARRYLELLEARAHPGPAREGLQRLATLQARQAERQAADFRFESAEASLAKARQWSAQAPAIARAERLVAQSRTTQSRLARSPSKAERARVPGLLAEAEAAMARGDYIVPPGTSAWDKLRVASAIAPTDEAVLALRREFVKGSRACFEKALTASQLRRAQSCLEARLAIDPGARDAAGARRRLAERWLAYAEERIGADDFSAADGALANARRWQPALPEIAVAADRLRRARGGTP